MRLVETLGITDLTEAVEDLLAQGFELQPGAVPNLDESVSSTWEPTALLDRGSFVGQLGWEARFQGGLVDPAFLVSLSTRGDGSSVDRMRCHT